MLEIRFSAAQIPPNFGLGITYSRLRRMSAAVENILFASRVPDTPQSNDVVSASNIILNHYMLELL